MDDDYALNDYNEAHQRYHDEYDDYKHKDNYDDYEERVRKGRQNKNNSDDEDYEQHSRRSKRQSKSDDRQYLTNKSATRRKRREEMANPKDDPYSAMSLRVPRRKKKSVVKRIDLVLVYKRKSEEDMDSGDRKKYEKLLKLRKRFENDIENKEFIEIQDEDQNPIYENFYCMKLHTPFKRLCQEAEKVKLEMPLKGCELYDDDNSNPFERFEEKYLETDNEDDFVAAPFIENKLHIFEGSEDEDKFFRPSIRSFLTYHILINMDIRDPEGDEAEDEPLAKVGLPWLIHEGVYSDAFILHDETADDPAEVEEIEEQRAREKKSKMSKEEKLQRRETVLGKGVVDTRKELDDTWIKFFKYQPIWKIRNYFGENITLYFAWVGVLISSLWIPTIFGIVVFIYGLVKSGENSNISIDQVNIDQASVVLTESLDMIKEAFDNDMTPWFALCICLWGTIFLEVWKRKNSTLAYEWDVDNFEASEPDRPEFFGTSTRPDPITKEEAWYYPSKRQVIKYVTSFSVLLFMVLVVCISASAVIVYRVIMSIDYCGTLSPTACLIATTVISSLLNAVSIMLLGKLYDKLAVILTDWENHRTQTMYDDALILKLFAFQFANSYTSLFYIAFFRGYVWPDGVFGMGAEYQDTCGSYNYTVTMVNGTEQVHIQNTNNNCMSMLSFQVLTMMIVKPFPKFFKDIILVWLLKKWKTRTWCRKGAKVDDLDNNSEPRTKSFIEREYLKPDLGNFTLAEYTEKVIIYGYLALFAASFSLAPFIALVVNLVDIRIDGKRMLWMYRRPIAIIRQDIGMWYNILLFLNICGVLSNAFLIAFTSSWGNQWDAAEKLWVVIIFENVVFALKFLLAVLIPDTPKPIQLAKRREKYQVAKILKLVPSEKPFTVKESEMGLLGSKPNYQNQMYNTEDENQFRRKKKKKINDYGPSRLKGTGGLRSVQALNRLKGEQIEDPAVNAQRMGSLNYTSDGETYFPSQSDYRESNHQPYASRAPRVSKPTDFDSRYNNSDSSV